MLKFCVKVFRTSLFPNPVMGLVHVWYDDTGPKFYTALSPPHTWPFGQGHGLRTFLLKFYVKVLRTSLFPNPVVYFFHVWCDDRCWSKILCSMIPNPILKVKVTELEFLYWSLCLSFYNFYFCEAVDGLIHVWHGDRNWSKVLYGTIPYPEGHRLRIFI